MKFITRQDRTIPFVPHSTPTFDVRKINNMANEQYAFLNKSEVPSRDDWQKAIEENGFDFELDPDLKPFEDDGFLPCKLMKNEAGFEITYDGSPELLSDFEDLRNGKDYCISFRWGGSMIECASVMIASYALAKKFGAIVTYEGEDPFEDFDAFLNETNEIIELAEKEF